MNLSGNEVYYTNLLKLLVRNMLCSKRHCQKVLIVFPLHVSLVRMQSLAVPAETASVGAHVHGGRVDINQILDRG